MPINYLNDWLLFTVAFTLLLVITFIMQRQSDHFYTLDVIVRKFSIMELEVPATSRELYNIIYGLFQLPPDASKKSLRALRGQLWLDFLFMPLAYGCIFLLCWRVAYKMQLPVGKYIFLAFAVVQLIPWICDIIENGFLLSQLRRDVKEISKELHHSYLFMEALKWGLAITATVCGMGAVMYFWCTGAYSATSLQYMIIVVVEIVIFLLASGLSAKRRKVANP
jgi:hypothetical protein